MSHSPTQLHKRDKSIHPFTLSWRRTSSLMTSPNTNLRISPYKCSETAIAFSTTALDSITTTQSIHCHMTNTSTNRPLALSPSIQFLSRKVWILVALHNSVDRTIIATDPLLVLSTVSSTLLEFIGTKHNPPDILAVQLLVCQTLLRVC